MTLWLTHTAEERFGNIALKKLPSVLAWSGCPIGDLEGFRQRSIQVTTTRTSKRVFLSE